MMWWSSDRNKVASTPSGEKLGLGSEFIGLL